RWLSARQLLDEVHVHRQRVPAAAWHEWALSDGNRQPLTRRLRRLGIGREAQTLFDKAATSPGWHALARLDATVRLVEALAESGAIRRGREAGNLLCTFLNSNCDIPDSYWSVRPVSEPNGADELWLRGAVLVRITGLASAASRESTPAPRSPDLAAALS